MAGEADSQSGRSSNSPPLQPVNCTLTPSPAAHPLQLYKYKYKIQNTKYKIQALHKLNYEIQSHGLKCICASCSSCLFTSAVRVGATVNCAMIQLNWLPNYGRCLQKNLLLHTFAAQMYSMKLLMCNPQNIVQAVMAHVYCLSSPMKMQRVEL